MYIIFESIPGNDPRLDSRMNYFGDFWHYSIYEVPEIPDDPIYVKWLDHLVISREVADSYKLTASTGGELSTAGPAKKLSEAEGASDTGGSKWIYQLSLEDHKNTIELMKSASILHIKKYLKNKEVETSLIQEMNKCVSVDQMQQWMSTYFDTQYTSVAGKKLRKTIDAQIVQPGLSLPDGAK